MIDTETLRDASLLRTYKTGTIFCKDGVGNDMYILVSGKVAVINSLNRRMVGVIGSGSYFNEFLAFSDEQVHVSTVALTDVTAIPISKFSTASFLSNESKLALELMRAMYERFSSLNDEYQTVTGHRWTPNMPTESAAAPVAAVSSKIDSNSISASAAEKGKKAASKAASAQTAMSDSVPEKQKIPVPTHSAISHDDCTLFPEGHTGKYELKLTKADNTHMCEIDYTCPVCGSTFKGLKILSSRLGASTTDNDTRKHYKNFDPIYYEVVTCPFCLFSTFASMFNTVEDVRTDFLEDLQIYHNAEFKFGTEPDTAAVFAGYYLALICAPQSFSKPQLVEANLLHKLSWLYADCHDEKMQELFTSKALERYLRGYVELDIAADKEVPLCMIIGELSFETGNLKDAKLYYHKAKTNPLSSAFLKRRATSRLENFKEYEQELEELEEADTQPGADADGKGRLFKRGAK